MKAARLYGIGDLRIEQVPAPSVTPPNCLRLRVRAAGICGSDLHNFRTGKWITRAAVIPGHEVAGEIIELGEGVKGFRLGDLIVADSRVNCGRCVHCQEGRPNVCPAMGYLGEVMDGGFAEQMILPAARALCVPPDVPAEIAALAEPLGVALRVIRRLDPEPNEPLLIAGAGPIGGFVAMLLAEFGFGPLFIVERNPGRAALVSELSGAEILPLDRDQLLTRVASSTGPRLAVEATGSSDMLRWLLGAVSAGGRIAMVGIFHGECPIDPNLIVERELDLRGCSVFCDEQKEALQLLPRLVAKLTRAIAGPWPLDRLPMDYASLLRGETSALKTIVAP